MEVLTTARRLGLVVLLAATGCQLTGPEGGLHISRMLPKADLSSLDGIPPQTEPDPGALGAPESTVSPDATKKPAGAQMSSE